MMMRDALGNPVTGATADGLDRYHHALHLLQCYIGDPVGVVDTAIAASPDMVMAHALRAWLHLLGTEPGGLVVARESHGYMLELPATDREAGHVRAIGQ